MPARTVFRCTDGYACDLAATPDGWVLAAVGLPAVDDRFVRNMDRSREWEHIRARLHPGRSYAEWGAAVADTAATLQLIVQRDSRTTTVATVTAEQFSGVAVVGGADPAYLWTAYDGEQWSVTLRRGRRAAGVVFAARPSLSARPSSATTPAPSGTPGPVAPGRPTPSTSQAVGARHAVPLHDTLTLPGRLPSLTPVDGGVAVCFERPSS